MAAARENINTPLVFTISAVFVIIVLVSVLLLEALFYRMEQDEVARKLASGANDALVVEQDLQRADMNGYRWLDQEKDVMQIPIGLAMELIAQEGLGPQGAAASE